MCWISGRVVVLIENPQAAQLLSPYEVTLACDSRHFCTGKISGAKPANDRAALVRRNTDARLGDGHAIPDCDAAQLQVRDFREY